MHVYYNNWREMYAAAAKERDELKRMLKDSKPMADLVTCPNCGKRFDRDMVEDGLAICPYCEEEVEPRMMTREEALERYDRIRYSLPNHADKAAVDIAFEALRGDVDG